MRNHHDAFKWRHCNLRKTVFLNENICAVFSEGRHYCERDSFSRVPVYTFVYFSQAGTQA
jgi:hypothetical protein